jgi:hypothetical protein
LVRLVPGLRARSRSHSVDAASLSSLVFTRALTPLAVAELLPELTRAYAAWLRARREGER